MKQGDEFSKPYARRTCPDGIPLPVWVAFARCVDNHTADNWKAYLDVHQLYYDADNKLRPEPLQPTLF